MLIQGNVSVTTATISANAATNNGGGIAAQAGTLNIANGAKIDNNTATTNGGGLYIDGTATVNFTGTNVNILNDVFLNKAPNGAGIYLKAGALNMAYVSVRRNNEGAALGTTYGGGLHAAGGTLAMTQLVTISANVATYGGGAFFDNSTYVIDSAIISDNNSTYGAVYIQNDAFLTLNTVEIKENGTESATCKGVYVANEAGNAFTISNASAISDDIYLIENAIVNISDAFNTNAGHTTIKIVMEEEYSNSAIKVGSYAYGVNADANKFTSDEDLIFVEDGQDIYIVKGVVLNTGLNKKYGSLISAINAVKTTSENTLMILEDIYVDETLKIESGETITIVSQVKEGTAGYGIYRAEGFTNTMFEVKGTLNLNNGSSTTSLLVSGLKNATYSSMFTVYGTLNMNKLVSLTNNKASNGGAVNVASGGTFNMNGGEIYGNQGASFGGAIYVNSGVVNAKVGTIGKYDDAYLGNESNYGSAIYAIGSSTVRVGQAGSESMVIIGNTGDTTIRIAGSSILQATNTLFENNRVTSNIGSILSFETNSTTYNTVTNCDIVNNTTMNAILNGSSKVNISGKQNEGIINNYRAIAVNGNTTTNVSNTVIAGSVDVLITDASTSVTGAKLDFTSTEIGVDGKNSNQLIYVRGATALTLTSSTVQYSKNNAILIEGSSTITMVGGSIINNKGIALQYKSSAKSTLTGVIMEGNASAINQTAGELTLAPLANNAAVVCEIKGNIGTAAVTVTGGILTGKQLKIDSNTGKALVVGTGGTVTIENGSISSNTLSSGTGSAVEVSGKLTLAGTTTVSNATNASTLYVQGEFRLEGQVTIRDTVKLHSDAYRVYVDKLITYNATTDNIITIELGTNHGMDDIVVTYAGSLTPQREFFNIPVTTGLTLKVNGQNIVLKEQVVKEYDKTTKELIATYGDIYEAIQDAKDGSMLLLNAKDIKLTSTINFTKSFTISAQKYKDAGDNLHDVTITRDIGFTGQMFKVASGKTVTFGRNTAFDTIYSSLQNGAGVITIQGNTNSTSNVIYSEGTVTLGERLKITGENATSAALIYSSGTLTIAGAEIYSNTITSSNIITSSGTFTLSSGRIYSNVVNNDDLIELTGATNTLSGGQIGDDTATSTALDNLYSNKATRILYVTGGITLSGTSISYNWASTYVVQLNSTTATREIKGTAVIKYNKASTAALYFNGTVTMSQGQVFANSSYGVSVASSSTFTMSNGSIHSNATRQVSLSSATFTMSGGRIGSDSNSAVANLVHATSSTVTINGSADLSGNSASSDAAVYFLNSTTTEKTFTFGGNATIRNNTSAKYTVYISGNSKFIMQDSASITNNTASSSALYLTGSTTYMSKAVLITGTISNNKNASAAAIYGVDVSVSSSSLTIGNGTVSTSLNIANTVHLCEDSKIYVNGSYASTLKVINVTPDETEDGTVIAYYATGKTASEQLFKDPSEELTYTLDGQEVKIGEKVIYNKTLDKYYTTLQKAIEKVDTTKTTNEILLMKDLTGDYAISSVVNIPTGNATTITISPGGNTNRTIARATGYTGNLFSITNGSKVTFNTSTAYTLTISGENIQSSGSLINISGSTVLVNAKVTLTKSKTSTDGGAIKASGASTSLTISGATLTANTGKDGGAIYVGTSATVTINSSTQLTSNTATNYGGALYIGGASSTTTISSATIKSNTAVRGGGLGVYQGTLTLSGTGTKVESNSTSASGYGGGIYATTSSKLNITQITITSNNAASGYGGGIAIIGGTTTIGSGTITKNTATNGGGIYLYGGTLNLNGGTIGGGSAAPTSSSAAITAGGNSATNGGGLYVTSDGVLASSAATSIKGNYASTGGGGIYFAKTWTSVANIINAIRYNYAASGGGIYSTSTLTMSAGTLSSNKASGQGGGIYSSSNGTLTISGSVISSNTAGTYGGGVACHGTLTMSGGEVKSNTAASYGGGIYSNCSSAVNLSGGTISSNSLTSTSDTYGGGIYSNASVNIKGATISSNSAKYGGGVYLWGGGTLSSGTINNNTASSSGGGICIGQSTLTMSGGTIKSNSAVSYGGGIYSYGAGLVLNGGKVGDTTTISSSASAATTAGGNSAAYGGGVAVTAGTLTKTNSNSAYCYIRGNYADWGGGVYVAVAVTVNSSNNTYLFTQTKYNYAKSYGGGVCVYNAAITLSASALSNNQTGYCGGGLAVTGSGSSTLGGVSIYSNTCSDSGGGVYQTGSGKMTISGASIYSNTAGLYGGGVYTSSSNTGSSMTSGTIYGNSATSTGYGGGAFGQNGGTFTFSGGTMGHNTSSLPGSSTANANKGYYGGGVILRSGTFKLSGGTIKHNYASKYGGGVYVAGGTFNNSGGTITYNRAYEYGGGMYLAAGTFSQNSTSLNVTYNNAYTQAGGGIYSKISVNAYFSVKNNTSTTHGGGIAMNVGTLQTNGNTYIQSNTATTTGGGVHVGGSSTIKIAGGTISSNTANGNGGAGVMVNTSSTSSTMSAGSIYSNYTPNYGGGMWVYAGKIAMSAGTIGNNLGKLPSSSSYGNSAKYGGNVAVTNTGHFAMTDGNLYCGYASSEGGNLYLSAGTVTLGGSGRPDMNYGLSYNGGGVRVSGGTFTTSSNFYIGDNKANNVGGGMYISKSLTLSGWVGWSTAAGAGGGIYVDSSATLTLNSNSLVYNNTAGSHGGGVYMATGTLAMSGGRIYNNAANASSGVGGGVCLSDSGATLTMTGGVIGQDTSSRASSSAKSNSAYNGGGLYIGHGSRLNISGGAIIGYNYAAYRGAGVYMNYNTTSDYATIEVRGTGAIKYNYSSNHGGGLYLYSPKNKTRKIWNSAGANNSSYRVTISGNFGTTGGGAYLYYGASGSPTYGLIDYPYSTLSVTSNNANSTSSANYYAYYM